MAEKHHWEQKKYTNEYLIPYLDKNLNLLSQKEIKILEVGCAEGGTQAALYEKGIYCEGVELEEGRAKIAQDKLAGTAKVTVGDITKMSSLDLNYSPYDIIVMRDVIEHIYDKKSAFENLHALLKDNGYLFITFPLKYSPYAGHQQNSKTWLKFVFYILLFPRAIRDFLCKLAKEEKYIEEFSYLRKCALTYQKLKKLTKKDWQIFRVDFFISRPVYKQRFGWPIVKMVNIPILRELANGCEVILKK